MRKYLSDGNFHNCLHTINVFTEKVEKVRISQ